MTVYFFNHWYRSTAQTDSFPHSWKRGWPIVLQRDAHTDSQHANTHAHLLGWHCAHHKGGTPFSGGIGANHI